METIYDHNPTQQEIERIGFLPKDLYMRLDADTLNHDLALLFKIRGNRKKMKHYLSLIQDGRMVDSFFRTINHP